MSKVMIELFKKYKMAIIIGVTIVIVIVVFSIGYSISASVNSKSVNITKLENLSFEERIQQLRKSYDYYTNRATSEELMVRWIKLFSKSTYALNGDGKYGRYDCVSSCYYFFNTFGSASGVKNVKITKAELDKYASMGYCKRRRYSTQVKPGDIMISYYSAHMSIVASVSKNYITYMDVNYKLKTMGIQNIYFNDRNVTGIYSVPFQLWAGDLLKIGK